MKIMRYHYRTDTMDFWFKEEDTALRMVEVHGGEYLGLVEVPQSSMPPYLRNGTMVEPCCKRRATVTA